MDISLLGFLHSWKVRLRDQAMKADGDYEWMVSVYVRILLTNYGLRDDV